VHQRSLAEKQEQRRGALAISGAQLDLLLGGADRNSDLSELSEEDLLNLEEAQTRAALRQTVQADQGELELLKQMGEIAAANRHRPDPRIIRLEAFLRTNLCANTALSELATRNGSTVRSSKRVTASAASVV
jgi:hypothetical protein